MKKIILLILPFLWFAHVLQAQNAPIMQFDKDIFNFGKVPEKGGLMKHTFEFTNVGNAPLIIASCKASCGCTTPTYSKEPVMPGGKGIIEVQFNPSGRIGKFNKGVSIMYNGAYPGSSMVTIEGEVYGGEVRPTPKEYIQYLPFDKKVNLLSDTAFPTFVKLARALYDRTGKVSINIESSSSRIQNDKNRTNQVLVMKRAEEAKEKLKKALDKAGINLDLVFFSAPLTLIQGPEYKDDWKESIAVYQQYQYLKITAY